VSTAIADALRMQRLNTMRRRSAEAQQRARRDTSTCECAVCQLKRGMLAGVLSCIAAVQAEDSPADVAATAPSRAH
jgi:hypothetical protein